MLQPRAGCSAPGWGVTLPEQGGRLASLNLLAMLVLIQPRVQLAFWAASALCWFKVNFSSTNSSGPSWQSCFQSTHHLACMQGWTQVQDITLGIVKLPLFAILTLFSCVRLNH